MHRHQGHDLGPDRNENEASLGRVLRCKILPKIGGAADQDFRQFLAGLARAEYASRKHHKVSLSIRLSASPGSTASSSSHLIGGELDSRLGLFWRTGLVRDGRATAVMGEASLFLEVRPSF